MRMGRISRWEEVEYKKKEVGGEKKVKDKIRRRMEGDEEELEENGFGEENEEEGKRKKERNKINK